MKKFLLAITLLLQVNYCFAQELAEESTKKIEISGNGNIMFGQIVSGHAFGKFDANFIDFQWQNFYSGRVNFTGRPTDWFTTIICPEIGSSFPVTATSSIMKETYKLQYRASLPKAVGIFDFDLRSVNLRIETGIMEYNFNPDIKNLGNYLYRSAAYPLTIRTQLDYPYATLVGIHPEVGLFEKQLKIGVLVNTITTQAPFNDISLGLLASFTPTSKIIDVGFGICFDRLFSVDDTLTDVIDSRSNMSDSTFTLRSTKMDLRFSFDPKVLFGLENIMGKNDLKIYFEGALLGVKDYDWYPDDSTVTPSLFNRLPLLIGFNIPTFKGLDFFSIELEYCNYPYAFDWWGGINGAPTPMPSRARNEKWETNYRVKDNLKWTVYLKKSISKFDIIGIVANDHKFYDTFSAEAQPATEQTLRTPDDWHWYVKLQYNL